MKSGAKVLVVCGIVGGLAVIGSVQPAPGRPGSGVSQEDARKQLAAKIERVLRNEGHNVSAFAFGDAMNVDYAKCGPKSVDVIKDVWGDRIRDLGLKQIVCTGVGGQKSIASL